MLSNNQTHQDTLKQSNLLKEKKESLSEAKENRITVCSHPIITTIKTASIRYTAETTTIAIATKKSKERIRDTFLQNERKIKTPSSHEVQCKQVHQKRLFRPNPQEERQYSRKFLVN